MVYLTSHPTMSKTAKQRVSASPSSSPPSLLTLAPNSNNIGLKGADVTKVKKSRVPKGRLYPTGARAEGAGCSVDNKVSASVKRRNKIKFYQNNNQLPTSENTLKKELRQLFAILRDGGYLRSDAVLDDPHKKSRKKNKDDGLRGLNVLQSFSISKDALQNIHELHTCYMGEVLKSSLMMCQNSQKMIIKPNILDLACIITNKQIGPEWNMELVPIDKE